MKITLSIEKEVIDMAKQYAKQQGQSLSEMVENYFKVLAAHPKQRDAKQLSPKVKKLRGILKTDKDFDYKATLTQERLKKYDV